MNSNAQPRSAASDQAALWAARLEGSTLEASDRAALETWLAEDPSHRTLLSNYCQFSADLEVILPALVETGAVRMPAKPKRERSFWRPSRLASLSAAAAAVFAFGFWFARPADHFENFAAPPGQRQAFTLDDGTRVELDAHTTLQFTQRGKERRAKLQGGEAFFVVSKDKSRPFIVDTPTGSVRVTGTTFDVRTDVAMLDVTVVEGSVQVQPGEATGVHETTSVALGASDRLSASNGGVTVRKLTAEALEERLLWRQGIVVFDGEPLSAALARFARYQGRTIQVTPAAASLHVSGRYSLDDVESFLAGFQEGDDALRFNRTPDGVLHVSRRSE